MLTASAIRHTDSALGEPPLPGPILLVVDDESGPREALQLIFQREFFVLTAEDGPTALYLAEEYPIDAAILDIRMAGMSGIDVLRQLKRMDPSTEVIMLTAYEALETAREALRLGACDYLDKPFQVAALQASVHKALQRRILSKEIQRNNSKLLELQSELAQQQMREELARNRGEIYASIIHDINGPLTIISGFVDMVNARLSQCTSVEGENLEMLRDRLNRISRQVTNCISISRRYLNFMRGRIAPNKTAGLNQVLTDLVELLKTHPAAQLHQFTVQHLDQDVRVKIDNTDLIQILLNLAINAFQSSSSPHRVAVKPELAMEAVDLSQWPLGPHDSLINKDSFQNRPPTLLLRMEDNGLGMASDLLPKIFEAYVTTKPVGQGTGLGLSIVKRLLEQAGGAIHVHSEVGVGSCFTLLLPCQPL